jgi:hypothetical protein
MQVVEAVELGLALEVMEALAVLVVEALALMGQAPLLLQMAQQILAEVEVAVVVAQLHIHTVRLAAAV